MSEGEGEGMGEGVGVGVDLLAPPAALAPPDGLPGSLASAALLAAHGRWSYAVAALRCALAPPLPRGARGGWGAREERAAAPQGLVDGCLARLEGARPDECLELGMSLFHGGDLRGAARCAESLLGRGPPWRARWLVNLLGALVSCGDVQGAAALEALLTPDLRAGLDEDERALWDANLRLLRVLQGRLYAPSSLAETRERLSALGDVGQWEGLALLEAHALCARGAHEAARAT